MEDGSLVVELEEVKMAVLLKQVELVVVELAVKEMFQMVDME